MNLLAFIFCLHLKVHAFACPAECPQVSNVASFDNSWLLSTGKAVTNADRAECPLSETCYEFGYAQNVN